MKLVNKVYCQVSKPETNNTIWHQSLYIQSFCFEETSLWFNVSEILKYSNAAKRDVISLNSCIQLGRY